MRKLASRKFATVVTGDGKEIRVQIEDQEKLLLLQIIMVQMTMTTPSDLRNLKVRTVKGS